VNLKINKPIGVKGKVHLTELTYDSVEEGVLSGEFAFIVTVENEDGSEDEIEYTGDFEIVGNVVTLNIETEDSGVVTLVLEK
jgi:hypothetical protein